MSQRHTPHADEPRELPRLWLLSDARNDAALEGALSALPGGSGLVFRHYHCDPAARRARFEALARLARDNGHIVILSGTDWDEARALGADGLYSAPLPLRGPRPTGALLLATAHNAEEIAAASAAGANGIFLSPVFATRSHPGAAALGEARFRELAARSTVPVIALGGMTAERAARLGCPRWGAIDGLALPQRA